MAANGKRQQPKHGLAFAGFPETADDTTRGRDPFAVSVTNEMFENQRLREELQQLKRKTNLQLFYLQQVTKKLMLSKK